MLFKFVVSLTLAYEYTKSSSNYPTLFCHTGVTVRIDFPLETDNLNTIQFKVEDI